MLKLFKSNKSRIWLVRCPYCNTYFGFSTSSPVFCITCHEELPKYYKLIDEVDEIINYYKSWRLNV
jgi:hypothetical protein